MHIVSLAGWRLPSFQNYAIRSLLRPSRLINKNLYYYFGYSQFYIICDAVTIVSMAY